MAARHAPFWLSAEQEGRGSDVSLSFPCQAEAVDAQAVPEGAVAKAWRRPSGGEALAQVGGVGCRDDELVYEQGEIK